MPPDIFRIALIGPESTGKTTLSRQLAEHYCTVWVPEYAREYVEKLDRPYSLEDIGIIAQRHHENERLALAQARGRIFVDTEYLVSIIWAEERFGQVPDPLTEWQERHPYDLYLLTEPDLPWEDDPVRENPHRREALFERYRKALEDRGLPYALVRGTGPSRLALAISHVDSATKPLT
jgi:NadR type nicotinamide-nucleotide adenylyltransferase